MSKNAILVSIIVGLLGFIGGFILANSLNKGEINELRGENARLKSSPAATTQNPQEAALSDEEIRQRIAEADRNPDNLEFQKSLGTALYRYGAMKKDAKLLGEVERLLNRVYAKNPTDKEVLTTLGHLYFDIGYFQKDNGNLKKSREFYEKLLAADQADYDIRTDYALTFFLHNPPDDQRTVDELEKALQYNQKHERARIFLIQALIRQGKMPEAEANHARLKEQNPNTPSMAQIQSEIGK